MGQLPQQPPPTIAPELQLLIHLSSPLPQQETITITSHQLDATYLFNLIRRHRMVLPVYPQLTAAPEKYPPSLLAQLQPIHQQHQQVAMQQVACLVQTVQRLKAANLSYLALKGPALSQQLYGSPILRGGSDLDFIVEPSNLLAAVALLKEEGFQRIVPKHALSAKQRQVYLRQQHDFSFVQTQTGIKLELHWRLFKEPSIMPLSNGLSALQQKQVVVAGQGINTLAGVDQLLYLMLHGSRHAWLRLFWLRDVAFWLQQHQDDLDWTQVIKQAKTMGIDRAILLGWHRVHDLYGVPMPTIIETAIAAQPEVAGLVQGSEAYFLGSQAHYFSGKLANRKRLEEFHKVLLAGQQLPKYKYSVRDFALVQFPDSLFFLYAWLRPLFFLIRFLFHNKDPHDQP